MPISAGGRRPRDYEPDRIWSSFRREHDIRIDAFVTLESFNNNLQQQLNRDKRLQNLGNEGRRLLMERARADFEQMPSESRERNLYIMKARGMISKDEFDIWTSQMGISRGAAEYRYRKFLGTEELVWELHHKNMLTRGEYGKLLRGRKLTYGQGYYRRRKYLAQEYGIPFRKWHAKKPKS